MKTVLRLASEPSILVASSALGALIALLTGLVERASGASIIGYAYHGAPLIWRVTRTLMPTEVYPVHLALDIAFWTVVSLFALVGLQALAFRGRGRRLPATRLLLMAAGLLFVALAVDLVHELGHALWGTLAGGSLQYLQVAWFELYPAPGLRTPFYVGRVLVAGLGSLVTRGLFLLGGSATTNILAWALGLLLWGASLGPRARVASWVAGVLGLLDLPLYVLLPQLGLRHWIFLGGETAEPLVGARALGVPDPLFYLLTTLTSAGLLVLYARTHPGHALRSLVFGATGNAA